VGAEARSTDKERQIGASSLNRISLFPKEATEGNYFDFMKEATEVNALDFPIAASYGKQRGLLRFMHYVGYFPKED